ncbi:hypothetical protein KI688_002528 [Linnemannia hyalina]|uniref:Uncharacterized protein n=1 Tax=Linnemannia hyalina TaxID=64524 RepID=A0A9P7XPU7_9FUNG|nr:hypothetical protein KI688_002528 [Linnemannia hyalina]
MSSSTISTPSVSSSSATGTASSAFATATTTESTGNSSRNGNTYASCAGMDCSNGSYGLGPLSLKSVFYFVGFLGLVIALFYTIFIVRRRRRHNNRRRDPEMAEHSGATATYRPDSGDEVSPPQYRAYILDQPYTDLESPIVYPDSVHYGTEQGLIQHLAVLQQQERSQLTTAAAAASSPDQDSTDDDNLLRPILTTTMTTTTTTTTTTTVVAPRSSSTTAVAGTTEGGEAETTTSTTITEPAPAHAQTFFTGRHLSILRMGLSNYSHNHSRSSRPNNNRSSSSSSNSSSGSRSTTQQRPVRQMWTNPAQYTESYMIINANGNSTPGSNGSGSPVMPPTLSRLRSMGPPPYIPTSDDEEAPALPPSYNVVVEISSASGTSSTIAATPSSEIAAH